MTSRTASPAPTAELDRRFCVAPMMDWSDRHCRMFWRQLTRRALLYTEMITTGALLHGDRDYLLQYQDCEHPLALQLGGSEPAALAQCAKLAQQWRYDEVNLNCGCPSDRVQNGAFGACLMARPALVADCVAAMRDACDLPVTVKHRTGIDDRDSYAELVDFVGTVRDAGCTTFIVHARKAWLQGLSPKQNREIPPLQYELVYQLKRDFPELEIIINGGIHGLDEAETHLSQVDGIMMGRAAYQEPYVLAAVDQRIYGEASAPLERREAIEGLLDYVDAELAQGVKLNHITRHVLGLFNGLPGARQFRRHLSEQAHRPGAGRAVLEEALEKVKR